MKKVLFISLEGREQYTQNFPFVYKKGKNKKYFEIDT